MVGGHRIVFFDPFNGRRGEWRDPASMILVNDELVVDAQNGGLDYDLQIQPMNDTVTALGVLDSAAGAQEQVAVRVTTDLDFYYYCELFSVSTITKLGLVELDASGFTTLDAVDIPPPLAPNPFDLSLVHAPPRVSCIRAGSRMLTGTLSAGLGVPVGYRLRITDLAVRFTSLTVIRTE